MGTSADDAAAELIMRKIEVHEREVRRLREQLRRLGNASPDKPMYRSEWAKFSAQGSDYTRAQVAALARRGVPSNLRREIWSKWSRTHIYHSPDLYRRLLDAAVAPVAFLRPIEQDVGRTLSDHTMFSSPKASGIVPLRNMLRAYSQRNPQVGYCQGMSLLAGCLLLNLEESDAFWLFCTMVENLLPPDYFTPGMAGLMADMEVMKELLKQFIPELQAHFELHRFDIAMVGIGWLMTLYVDSCPLETALRVWDILFCEGDKILFCFALAVMRVNRDELLSIKDAGHISMALKQIFANLYSPDEVLPYAFKMMKNLKRETLQLLRKRTRPR